MGSLVHIARQSGWEPKPDSSALSAEELQKIKDLWEQKKEDRVSLPSIADDHDINIYEPPDFWGKSMTTYIHALCFLIAISLLPVFQCLLTLLAGAIIGPIVSVIFNLICLSFALRVLL